MGLYHINVTEQGSDLLAPWSLSVPPGHPAVRASRLSGCPAVRACRSSGCACFAAVRACQPLGRMAGGLRRVPGFVEAVVAHDQLLDLLQLACVKCWRRFVE